MGRGTAWLWAVTGVAVLVAGLLVSAATGEVQAPTTATGVQAPPVSTIPPVVVMTTTTLVHMSASEPTSMLQEAMKAKGVPTDLQKPPTEQFAKLPPGLQADIVARTYPLCAETVYVEQLTARM